MIDRQERLEGFSSEALGRTRALLIGAGGLGGAVAGCLARKGIGRLDICDPDTVEVTNLNRQYFFQEDLHQPKAFRLAHNAAREGTLGSTVLGHHVAFTGATAAALADRADLAVCGVDNNQTRRLASRFFRAHNVPVVVTAVSESADYGWVFVQQPAGACLACVFPTMGRIEGKRKPCPPVPAVLDILRVVGGIVLYAVDSLLMPRRRHWNFRSVHLVGGSPDCVSSVEQRAGCALCGDSPSDLKELQ